MLLVLIVRVPLLRFIVGSLHAFGNIAPLIIAYMRVHQPSTSLRYHVNYFVQNVTFALIMRRLLCFV